MDPPEGGYAQSESYGAIVSILAQQDKVPWYKKSNLRILYFIMFPACLGVQITSGLDVSTFSGLQAVPSWLSFFHNPHSALLGLMSAVYWLGSIIALPFVPTIVDGFGRRFSIMFGSVLIIIGAALQGTAQNSAMFIVARFILGIGNALPTVAASTLTGELSHPKERDIMCSFIGTFWTIGSVIASGTVLGTFDMSSDWGWRIPSFLQIIPSLLQVTFIWFLPESPRWLISKGRGDEAYALLVKYHAEGDENSEFVKAEFSQIKQTLEIELRNAKISWKEVFSTPGVRKRVVIGSFLGLFAEWSGIGLTAYYLPQILDSIGVHDYRTKNIINISLNCWGLICAMFLALKAPRFPRRGAYLTCSISMLTIFIAWTALSAKYSITHSNGFAQAVLAAIFLYVLAYSIGYSALMYTFLVELFPFRVRAKGLSVFTWCVACASCLSQFVNPIGIDSLGWKYYIVYCVLLAFQVAFVYLMFPETSKYTLEELTFMYEGDQRQEMLERMTENVIALRIGIGREGDSGETNSSAEKRSLHHPVGTSILDARTQATVRQVLRPGSLASPGPAVP